MKMKYYISLAQDQILRPRLLLVLQLTHILLKPGLHVSFGFEVKITALRCQSKPGFPGGDTPVNVPSSPQLRQGIKTERLAIPSNPSNLLLVDGASKDNKTPQHGIDDLTEDIVDILAELEEKIRVVIDSFDMPYDPSNESTPGLAAYHTSFGKVEASCANTVGDAIKVLSTSIYQDAETKRIIERLSANKLVEYPEARRLGMLGDSGVGKITLCST